MNCPYVSISLGPRRIPRRRQVQALSGQRRAVGILDGAQAGQGSGPVKLCRAGGVEQAACRQSLRLRSAAARSRPAALRGRSPATLPAAPARARPVQRPGGQNRTGGALRGSGQNRSARPDCPARPARSPGSNRRGWWRGCRSPAHPATPAAPPMGQAGRPGRSLPPISPTASSGYRPRGPEQARWAAAGQPAQRAVADARAAASHVSVQPPSARFSAVNPPPMRTTIKGAISLTFKRWSTTAGVKPRVPPGQGSSTRCGGNRRSYSCPSGRCRAGAASTNAGRRCRTGAAAGRGWDRPAGPGAG